MSSTASLRRQVYASTDGQLSAPPAALAFQDQVVPTEAPPPHCREYRDEWSDGRRCRSLQPCISWMLIRVGPLGATLASIE